MKNPQRCLLLVPGQRPEPFEKAFSAGMVCIDLEDVVNMDQKDQARRNGRRSFFRTLHTIDREYMPIYTKSILTKPRLPIARTSWCCEAGRKRIRNTDSKLTPKD
jgi:hypothetical protein